VDASPEVATESPHAAITLNKHTGVNSPHAGIRMTTAAYHARAGAGCPSFMSASGPGP
jgi:hypothetical protein